MNRSIISTFAMVALSVIAASGCGVVEGDEWVVPTVNEISMEQNVSYRLCREVANDLRGQEISAWTVRDYEHLVAVKFGGRVYCLDAVSEVRRVGAIPVDDDGVDGPGCAFCGTPLPAEQLISGPEDDDLAPHKM
jgi:hypothetical protein